MLRLALLVPAFLALAHPASAFDIEHFLPLVGLDGDAGDEPIAFTYIGPAGSDLRALELNDTALAQAISDPAAAKASTGIDFSGLSGILIAGDPASLVTVLLGPNGFAADAPARLAADGYETLPGKGPPLLSRGVDYGIEILRMKSDLLGGGIGKAQRLLFAGDYVLRTPATEVMVAARSALSAPEREDTAIWRALFNGIETATGPDAILDGATGLLSPDGLGFFIAAATRSGQSSAAHWAVTVPGLGDCTDLPSLPYGVKGHIQALADPDRGVTIWTGSVGDTCLAVFSAAYGPENPQGGIETYRQIAGLQSTSPR